MLIEMKNVVSACLNLSQMYNPTEC